MEAIRALGDRSDLGVHALGTSVRETGRDVGEDSVEVSADRARELLKGRKLRARGPSNPLAELLAREVHLPTMGASVGVHIGVLGALKWPHRSDHEGRWLRWSLRRSLLMYPTNKSIVVSSSSRSSRGRP